ncbi:MAG: XTP/dITP diphosphohydrolase [Candidatus Sumerlaeota bacterium]|nr:XTP/dITP diphosphohydrolase [Candidatus Sumerlaeota bacterium]
MEILIATGNAHKVGEIAAILAGLAVTWRSTADWPDAAPVEENGATYAANAELKAVEWARRTGLPTVADDSGLEVEALGGRPGLYSARYATHGEDPLAKMLGELHGVEEAQRGARFVCHAVLAGPAGVIAQASGVLGGRIGFEKRGVGGFGFDPIFVPEGYDGRHLAQLPEDEKNRISHRGRAFQALRPAIERMLDQ